MRLGNTEIKNGLCLAPMAGFTDLPMRRQCRRFGAEYTVTEMVSAAALCYGDLKTADLAYLTEGRALRDPAFRSRSRADGTGGYHDGLGRIRRQPLPCAPRRH